MARFFSVCACIILHVFFFSSWCNATSITSMTWNYHGDESNRVEVGVCASVEINADTTLEDGCNVYMEIYEEDVFSDDYICLVVGEVADGKMLAKWTTPPRSDYDFWSTPEFIVKNASVYCHGEFKEYCDIESSNVVSVVESYTPPIVSLCGGFPDGPQVLSEGYKFTTKGALSREIPRTSWAGGNFESDLAELLAAWEYLNYGINIYSSWGDISAFPKLNTETLATGVTEGSRFTLAKLMSSAGLPFATDPLSSLAVVRSQWYSLVGDFNGHTSVSFPEEISGPCEILPTVYYYPSQNQVDLAMPVPLKLNLQKDGEVVDSVDLGVFKGESFITKRLEFDAAPIDKGLELVPARPLSLPSPGLYTLVTSGGRNIEADRLDVHVGNTELAFAKPQVIEVLNHNVIYFKAGYSSLDWELFHKEGSSVLVQKGNGSLIGDTSTLEANGYYIVGSCWSETLRRVVNFRYEFSVSENGQILLGNDTGGCEYHLSPVKLDFTSSGGSEAFQVIAAPGCEWSITEDADWVEVSEIGGLGSSRITVSTFANPNAEMRTTTVHVADAILVITQDGLSTAGSMYYPLKQLQPASAGRPIAYFGQIKNPANDEIIQDGILHISYDAVELTSSIDNGFVRFQIDSATSCEFLRLSLTLDGADHNLGILPVEFTSPSLLYAESFAGVGSAGVKFSLAPPYNEAVVYCGLYGHEISQVYAGPASSFATTDYDQGMLLEFWIRPFYTDQNGDRIYDDLIKVYERVGWGGDVSGDVVMSMDDGIAFIPHKVCSSLHIGLASKLTINPGCLVFVYGTNTSISVDGELFACGTPQAKILITSGETIPSAGWKNISFKQTSSGSIDYSIIEYAGGSIDPGVPAHDYFYKYSAGDMPCYINNAAVIIESCPSITNTIIRCIENKHYLTGRYRRNGVASGLLLLGSASPLISDLALDDIESFGIYSSSVGSISLDLIDFTNCYAAGIVELNSNDVRIGRCFYGDEIRPAHYLHVRGTIGSYALLNGKFAFGQLVVPIECQLEISSGSILYGASSGSRLTVYGCLVAKGSVERPILFTSPSEVPSPGDWDSIVFEPSSSGILSHASILFAGGHVDPGAYERESYSHYSDGSGITCYLTNAALVIHSSPVVSYVTIGFTENTQYWSGTAKRNGTSAGVLLLGNSNPSLSSLTIFESESFGVFSASSNYIVISDSIISSNFKGIVSDVGTVDARYCFWGLPSGPFHSRTNPSGSANAVSDNVLFYPWIGLQVCEMSIFGNNSIILPGDFTPTVDDGTDFGMIELSKNFDFSFILTNTGTLDFELGDIYLDNTSQFHFLNTLPPVLEPAESTLLKVEFSPTSIGLHRAQISVGGSFNAAPYHFLIQGRGITADDGDGDGIIDSWEIANGLDCTDPYDADLDPDGDGYTNIDEFKAGSDPNDAQSTPNFTRSMSFLSILLLPD